MIVPGHLLLLRDLQLGDAETGPRGVFTALSCGTMTFRRSSPVRSCWSRFKAGISPHPRTLELAEINSAAGCRDGEALNSIDMAETIADLRDLPRRAAYAELTDQVRLVLEGIDDPITGMATISSLLHGALGFLWTGFYRVVEAGKLMRIGPYQGSLGCLEIAFGKGV